MPAGSVTSTASAGSRPATAAVVGALIMLAGIYYGAQYGGSTTSILVNIPGEATSVVTALDGHQMAKQGRAGPALAIAAIGSFFAGCIGTVIIAAFAPPLTEVAFKFGPAEYFSLMVLGLIGAVVLASGSLLKAIAMIVLGLLLGMVGTDVNSGVARYSFDIPELTDGINFVVIAMGVFGYGEIIANLSRPEEDREVFTAKVQGLFPTAQDFKRMFPAVLRGTALGSALGILPGGGAVMAAFASGHLGVLVATTVIEVGVDVPNATLIVIEHADRFGLAQLHQLRGRVGRGSGKSNCLLIRGGALSETSRARLALMRETNDGFRIAEEDLRLRGAGELLGTKQSGEAGFRLATPEMLTTLLPIATDDARLLIDRDGGLEGARGQAARTALYLFEREAGVALLRSG